MVVVSIVFIVVLIALIAFWLVTRIPDISWCDVQSVASSFDVSLRPLVMRNAVLTPWRAVRAGAVVVCEAAPGLVAIEQRRAMRLLVDEVVAAAAPLRERLAQEPSAYARRAFDQLEDDLATVRVRSRLGDASNSAGARAHLEFLRHQVIRMGDVVFRLDHRLREARALLKHAQDECADHDAQAALRELEDRINELAMADVGFSQPDSITVVERELERIQQFLFRSVAGASGDADRECSDSDPWEILGVCRNATSEDIRAAYHAKIAQCHPDRIESRIAALSADPEIRQLLRQWFTERAQHLNDAYRKLTTKAGGAHG
ncbi:MAG: J domain-containing protein [Candidatus Uhrbacteria bacterium]